MCFLSQDDFAEVSVGGLWKKPEQLKEFFLKFLF